MGEFEKYIARSFYFWMVRFLRAKYSNVNELQELTTREEMEGISPLYIINRLSSALAKTRTMVTHITRYHPSNCALCAASTIAAADEVGRANRVLTYDTVVPQFVRRVVRMRSAPNPSSRSAVVSAKMLT